MSFAYTWSDPGWPLIGGQYAPNAGYVPIVWCPSWQKAIAFAGGGSGNHDKTFEFSSNTWTLLSPTNAPSARTDFAMAWDPKNERVVLFGGGNYFDDIWTFDGTDWTQQVADGAQTSPDGTVHANIAFDPRSGLFLMFGGTKSGNFPTNNTWTLDPDTFAWTELSPSTVPTARDWPGLIWDESRETILMFRGDTGLYELHEWTGTDWADHSVAAADDATRDANHVFAPRLLNFDNKLYYVSVGASVAAQVWELNSDWTWTQLTTTSPPTEANATQFFTGAFVDPVDDAVYVTSSGDHHKLAIPPQHGGGLDLLGLGFLFGVDDRRGSHIGDDRRPT